LGWKMAEGVDGQEQSNSDSCSEQTTGIYP
jgi:hypothetical protein